MDAAPSPPPASHTRLTVPSHLTRLLVIAALVLSSLGAFAGAAGAAVPRDFVGIVSEDLAAGDPAYRAATLQAQAQTRVGLLRQTFSWAAIETAPGRYDGWDFADRFIGEAAAHGIRVLPILIDAPSFHSSGPGRGAERGYYPPNDPAAMGRFGARLVERYGPSGTFWADKPHLRHLAVRSWQIWNEPNLPVYWRPRPNARQYVALLKAAAAGIKAADPGAEIVTAGLPNSRLGTPLERYVRDMYRAGGATAFDTLAINPYERDPKKMIALVERIRRLMNARRDRSGRIWVTEFGWSDVGPRSRFRAGRAGQARNIKAALLGLAKKRGRLKLRGTVLYSWRDGSPYGAGDFWGLHTGLHRRDGSRKPAFFAFRAAARRLVR